MYIHTEFSNSTVGFNSNTITSSHLVVFYIGIIIEKRWQMDLKQKETELNILNLNSGLYIVLNYFICSYHSPIVLWSRKLFLPYLSHSTYVKRRLREIKENALCKSTAVNPSKSSSKADLTTMLKRGYIQQAFIMCLSYARCLIMVMEQELGRWRAFFLNSFILHIFTGYLSIPNREAPT